MLKRVLPAWHRARARSDAMRLDMRPEHGPAPSELSFNDQEFIAEHLAEGRVYLQCGLWDKARECFEAVLQRFPANTEAASGRMTAAPIELRWHGEVAGRFAPAGFETISASEMKQRGNIIWSDGPAAGALQVRLMEADTQLADAGIVEIDPPSPDARAFLSLISPRTGEAFLVMHTSGALREGAAALERLKTAAAMLGATVEVTAVGGSLFSLVVRLPKGYHWRDRTWPNRHGPMYTGGADVDWEHECDRLIDEVISARPCNPKLCW